MDRFSAKQPDEEYYVLFDFGNVIGTDTVASATVTAIDLDDDSDVSDTILDATSQTESGQYVYVWVQAGTDGHKYQVTCLATTSAGEKYELDAILPVRSI